MADCSVDAIVTDPPYELGFMGRAWDKSGIAYDPVVWAEALRILKPGGHLLAFGGSRTYHRLACAIEDAGFEIRDQMQWVYGSGFPKSLDVSKAIDKAAGADTDHAKRWSGWGTALKPAHEPICLARKPLVGTVASNVLEYGTGAMNIDACRVATTETWSYNADKNGTTFHGQQGERIKQSAALKGAPTVDSNPLGRWPANFIHDGSDEVVGLFPESKDGVAVRHRSGGKNCHSDQDKPPMDDMGYGGGGSAARFFYCAKASKRDRDMGLSSSTPITSAADMVDRTEGSAGMNSPRAGAGRTSGSRNDHPTVKPIALMRYLCRLVTPPGGVVFDPFAGSGSTLVAAKLEGFQSSGAEMRPDAAAIAQARVDGVQVELDLLDAV